MAKTPIDPQRAQLADLLDAIQGRLATLRDHAAVPGSAWLAESELRLIEQQLSQLETLLADIKDADAENGY